MRNTQHSKQPVRWRKGNRMSSFFTKKQDINMIQENENQKDTDMHLLIAYNGIRLCARF
jgi:hypothetical protein